MSRNTIIDNICIGAITGMSLLGLIDLLAFDSEVNLLSKVMSITTSLMGLLGVALYYKRINIFIYFILFWICIQLVELSEYGVNSVGLEYWRKVFASNQFLNFNIHETFNLHGFGYKIELNLIPFIYLSRFYALKLNVFRGKKLTVIRFNEKMELDTNQFNGIILKRLTVFNERKSFLVELEKQIMINNLTINYCIISESKSKNFGINKPLSLMLYGVSDETITKNEEIDHSKLEYIDWIEGIIK